MPQPRVSEIARNPAVQATPRVMNAWLALVRKKAVTVIDVRTARVSPVTRTQVIWPRIVSAASTQGT